MQSVCVLVALENPRYMQQRVARTKIERERMTTALLHIKAGRFFLPREISFLFEHQMLAQLMPAYWSKVS